MSPVPPPRRPALHVLLALLVTSSLRCGSAPRDPALRPVPRLAPVALWASPAGRGILCTQEEPCDLVQAQAQVRARAPRMDRDLAVNLLDGTYELSAPLSFGADDSGAHGHSVIWQAAPHAVPIISGGTRLTGWSSDLTRPGVFRASVAAGFDTRQLYVNGVRQPRAGGRLPVTLIQTPTGYTADRPVMAAWQSPTDIEFEYSGASATNGHHWTDSRCPVAAIAGAAITMAMPCWGNLTVDAGIPWFGAAGGAPTRVENAIELLDEPGEWYLQRATGTVFYRPLPGEDLAASTVIAPRLESLLEARGTPDAPVHHLQFQGLTFAYATWLRPGTPVGFAEMQANFTHTGAAGDGRQGGCTTIAPAGSCPFGAWTRTPANITFRAAHDIVLERDTFIHLGGLGLGFEAGSTDVLVSRCTFTDVSGTGIQVGGTDDPTPNDVRNIVARVTVADSYLHDLPSEYLGGVGIFVGYTQDVIVRNNLITNTPYTGISVGWGGWSRTREIPDPPLLRNASRRNVVARNHVFNVLQALGDGGPLYSNGNRGTAFGDGDTYTGNHFHHQFRSGNGVYNDIGSRFITIDRQVVYAVPIAWGGCATSGDLVFQDGFWSPPGPFWGCLAPTGISVLRSRSLDAADPALACADDGGCASIVDLAGPQGEAAATVDGRGETVLVDDDDPAILYTGAWTNDAARAWDDLGRTLHLATADGASFEYAFTGAGIDYVAEFAPNRGNVELSVDGTAYATVGCTTQELIFAQVGARVRGLAPGPHVLRGVKRGGAVMSLDALRVYPGEGEGRPLDDAAPDLSYTGAGWRVETDDAPGASQGTRHVTAAEGDAYTLTWTGTGADLIGSRDVVGAEVAVAVDGRFVQRVNTSGPRATQQVLFRTRDLAPGAHAITATRRGGGEMDLDRVNLYGSRTVEDDDGAVVYRGPGWSTARGDAHVTARDGDAVGFTFTGTGVEFVGEAGPVAGVIDVRVDDLPRGRVFGYRPAVAPRQTLYRLRGLPHGVHRLDLTARGGRAVVVDSFRVFD